MYKAIVSFHRPWVRPIKRGKAGKDVEFGAKTAMSHVDGFLFVDAVNHENFAEADEGIVRKQIEKYKQRFDRWFRRKQKERNLIEGNFGNGREHYRLNRMWYHGREGSEIWTRGGVLAMNLKTALVRM